MMSVSQGRLACGIVFDVPSGAVDWFSRSYSDCQPARGGKNTQQSSLFGSSQTPGVYGIVCVNWSQLRVSLELQPVPRGGPGARPQPVSAPLISMLRLSLCAHQRTLYHW